MKKLLRETLTFLPHVTFIYNIVIPSFKKCHELLKLQSRYIGLCESWKKGGFSLYSKHDKNLFSFQKENLRLFSFQRKREKTFFFKSPFSQKKKFQFRLVKKKVAAFFIKFSCYSFSEPNS